MKMIRRYFLFIFLISLLFFMGCSTTVPTNQAPTINSTPITSTLIGELYTYDVEATDGDGDTLTYSLTSNPGGMTIDSATGVITWTPTMFGNYNVGLEVSDGDLSDTQSFTLGVTLPMVPYPVTKLSPPTGVNASDDDSTIYIYWDSVSGATHYQVYRALSLIGTRIPISGWNPQNYYLDDNPPMAETTYWYWVKAATSDSGDNASDFSNPDTGYCTSSWYL
jgi:hypothetical protein